MEKRRKGLTRVTLDKERAKKKNPLKWFVILLICILLLILRSSLWGGTSGEIEEADNAESAVTDEGDQSVDVFDGAVFVGNSYVDTLKNYNLPKNGRFLSRVGLTVETVFDKSVTSEGRTTLEVLSEKDFSKIILVFGENELGWSYPEVFIKDYVHLIESIKERQPKAKIYIMGILPITEKESEKNEDNTNNARIREYNERLRIMAGNANVTFIPSPTALMTNSCALIDDASTDGVHLKYEYNKIWLKEIKCFLE